MGQLYSNGFLTLRSILPAPIRVSDLLNKIQEEDMILVGDIRR